MIGALLFLGGGVTVPRIVGATASSGERDAYFPLPPARILDTRFGPSPLAVGTKVGPGQTIDLQVRGQGGVPVTAAAVVLNVTAVSPTLPSHLTVWPSGIAMPVASSLNFDIGEIIPNAVSVKIGANGKVSIYNNSGSVHVIADVNGYYEDHNHDDRYDTKAQVDAKVATAITTPNHVTGAQVADGSLTFDEHLVGSQSFSLTLDTPIVAHGCENIASVSSINIAGMQAGDAIIPKVIGNTGNANLVFMTTTAQTVGAGVQGYVVVCSVAATTLNLTGSFTIVARVVR